MFDAILYAVQKTISLSDFGGFSYDYSMCQVMPDGHPPPRAGNIFVAIHQKAMTSDMMNALNEYYDFSVTLTMRLTNVPLDRVGDQLLATQLATQKGFNRRANVLGSFLHMNWDVLELANQNLLQMMPTVANVYGFSEPARLGGVEVPQLVGSEWFFAEPDDPQAGLKAEISLVNCRRGPQAIGSYS